MRKLILTNCLYIVLLLFFVPAAMGQPYIDEDDVMDNEVPFDDGVFLLIGAAVVYGVNRGLIKKNAK